MPDFYDGRFKQKRGGNFSHLYSTMIFVMSRILWAYKKNLGLSYVLSPHFFLLGMYYFLLRATDFK